MISEQVITIQELQYHLEMVNSCKCHTCQKNKDMFIEWYGMKQNQMIESISTAVKTILSVKDFRNTKMTVGDLKKMHIKS